MEAREWFDKARDGGNIIRLNRFADVSGAAKSVGRVEALILDHDESIAVLLRSCSGLSRHEEWPGGTIVQFARHPEGEPRIVGRPANIDPNLR